MDTNPDKTIEKMNRMFELIQNDTLTPKEVEQFLELVLGVIRTSKEEFDLISEKNLDKIKKTLDYINEEHSAVISKVTADISEFNRRYQELLAYRPKDGRNGLDGISPDPNEVARIAEEALKPLIPKIDDLEKSIPLLGESIRDGLELLMGDDRLSRESIKGLDDIPTNRDLEDLRRIAGSAMPVTTNFFNGLRAKNLNIIGATASQSGDTVNITVPSSGGGLSKETPSGTIDDSNLTFTVTHQPFFININGLIYEEGDGTYSSYAGGTITLSGPVGTGGFIKSYY